MRAYCEISGDIGVRTTKEGGEIIYPLNASCDFHSPGTWMISRLGMAGGRQPQPAHFFSRGQPGSFPKGFPGILALQTLTTVVDN